MSINYVLTKPRTLCSPKNQATFELSAPHRILTIAFRRGILEGIETLDELFRGQQKNIIIKKEYLDKPILVASGARGLSIDLNKALPSERLTEYLRLRGQKIGLTSSITFYSLRRKAAQQLSKTVGPEMAQAIMAHDPKSTVLEEYYTANRTTLLDLTALALNEDGASTMLDHQQEALAITRLGGEQLQKMGPMLNMIFDELRETDDDYPHDGSSAVKKNRDRVLRRAAFRSVMRDLVEEASRKLTIDETNLRVEEIQSMSHEFNQRVLAHAKEYIVARSNPRAGDESPMIAENDPLSTPDINLDQTFEEPLTANDHEPDAEDQFALQIDEGQEVETYPDEITDVRDELSSLEYATAARAAMEVWLSVGTDINSQFGQKQYHGRMVFCQLCQEDETVDDEMKAKEYHPSKIQRHRDSEFHSAFRKLIRRAQIRARDEGLDGVQCEICAAIAPNHITIPVHATVKTLTRHIETSTSMLLYAEDRDLAWWTDLPHQDQLFTAHERLKRDLGWYEENFRGDLKYKAACKAAEEARRLRKLAENDKSLRFADLKRLQRPIPVPGYPGIQFGSAPGELEAIAKGHPGIIMTTKPDPSRYLTENRMDSIKLTSLPTVENLHRQFTECPKFKGAVKLVPLTAKNLMDDRARLIKLPE